MLNRDKIIRYLVYYHIKYSKKSIQSILFLVCWNQNRNERFKNDKYLEKLEECEKAGLLN